MFTQALKDAGFNNANASEAVTVKDATPKDEKVKTICDVTQIITGVTPTEGNTPPFGTALGNAVATAPSVSPDKNLDAPKGPTWTLPEIPGLGSGGGGGGFALPSLPKAAFVIPALFDDGLSHLDPPVCYTRQHMSKITSQITSHMPSNTFSNTFSKILLNILSNTTLPALYSLSLTQMGSTATTSSLKQPLTLLSTYVLSHTHSTHMNFNTSLTTCPLTSSHPQHVLTLTLSL